MDVHPIRIDNNRFWPIPIWFPIITLTCCVRHRGFFDVALPEARTNIVEERARGPNGEPTGLGGCRFYILFVSICQLYQLLVGCKLCQSHFARGFVFFLNYQSLVARCYKSGPLSVCGQASVASLSPRLINFHSHPIFTGHFFLRHMVYFS